MFPPGLSPSKQRVLAQWEQKRRKDNKKNWTNQFCTLVVARLASSFKNATKSGTTISKKNTPNRPWKNLSPSQLPKSFSPALFHSFAPGISKHSFKRNVIFSQSESAGMDTLRISRDFAGISRGCPKSSRNKSVFNFWRLTKPPFCKIPLLGMLIIR